MSTKDDLLLVIPLTRELPEALVERAARVAAKLSLEVTVLCPAVSTSAETATADDAPVSSREDTLALAQAQAETAATALRTRGIPAHGIGQLCLSDLEASLGLAKASCAAFIMVAASRYCDWAESLTQSSLLDRIDIPVWIENGGAEDGVVLGTLDSGNDQALTATLDDPVAEAATRIAHELETDVHLLHAIAPQSAMERAAEAMGGHDDTATASELAEAEGVTRAHELAERWRIPSEHVHLDRAEFGQALERWVEAMHPSLVVLGARSRTLFARLFSRRIEHRLLDALRTDLLILRH